MILEENRVYKSRAGQFYKITKINGLAEGEHIQQGYRNKLFDWNKNGRYAFRSFDRESPLDLIEDVTDAFPEEVL